MNLSWWLLPLDLLVVVEDDFLDRVGLEVHWVVMEGQEDDHLEDLEDQADQVVLEQ